MKLGDVLKKERERKRLTVEDAVAKMGIPQDAYEELEGGSSPIEEWGPKLALIAIKLSTPTSRLISETGKSAQTNQEQGQCGRLIKAHRERRELSQRQLAEKLGWPEEELTAVEDANTPLERYAPLLLRFAEVVDQPIFNLFYPCGLPFAEINDYP